MFNVVAAWPFEMLVFAVFWEVFFGHKKFAFLALIIVLALFALII